MTSDQASDETVVRRVPEAGAPSAAGEPEAGEPVAAATGVASGGLGTGANLDDTQVMRATDLAPDESGSDAFISPPTAAEPAEPLMAASPVETADATGAVADTRAEAVPTGPVRPVVSPRQTGPGPRALAGVLAVILVALVGVAILTTAGDDMFGTGQSAPTVGSAPTTAPAADEEQPGNGDDKCKGKGNGRGNDKCDKPGEGGGD